MDKKMTTVRPSPEEGMEFFLNIAVVSGVGEHILGRLPSSLWMVHREE
jgi:hypothetical protein